MKISREELSWSLYDVANSAFATVVMAGFFPILFKLQTTAIGKEKSTFFLGLANSIVSIIIAFLFPVLGNISDKRNSKKLFLFILTILGAFFTSLITLSNRWETSLNFYIIASIGFFGANVFYDSLLTHISKNENRDFISSLGYSLGYLGGGIIFLFTILIYQNKINFLNIEPIKLSFLITGIWWLLFSIPLFSFVKEIKFLQKEKKEKFFSFFKKKENKQIILFLIAYWFYIDGVDTIIKMSVDYGQSIGISSNSLILALLMVQFLGFPFALIYSIFAKIINTKNAIIIAIIGYILITFLGIMMKNSLHFFILAFLVSIFQGGIQALSRSYFSNLITEKEAGKLFGIYNMVGKFATIIGPFLVGSFTLMFKNHRIGISSILILFIIGLFLFLISTKENSLSKEGKNA